MTSSAVLAGITLLACDGRDAVDASSPGSGPDPLVVAAVAPSIIAMPAARYTWQTVANNHDVMPGSAADRTFNSFNQPAIDTTGLVVFRGRSRGGPPEGSRAHGIYVRDMASRGAIDVVADGGTAVPAPNDLLATFIEFPSVPRIAPSSGAIVTRGNHQPVWRYEVEAEEARAGTSGVYARPAGGALVTGASKLGAVPPDGTYTFTDFAVPGTDPPIAFEVFPGAPSITDDAVIVFKGNFTDAEGSKTGVYFRELLSEPAGGSAPIERIADSDTTIPLPQGCPSGTTFGSTAPPSAAGQTMVFVGLDDEANPSCGGVYRAPLAADPPLTPLVTIGSVVPGVPDATFTRLGEGLSYDGRHVGVWGAWGDETRTVRLDCPAEGNRDRVDYCNHTGRFAGGLGDPNSVCEGVGPCYQEAQVPVHQGIFVHDTRTGQTRQVASTGGAIDDFVDWSYSGRVPGSTGDEGGRRPRRGR